MKEFFFTSTQPKHPYKSEQFFIHYNKNAHESRFVSGSSQQFSYFKKMLVLKKFFMWYYNIKTWRFFIKIFKKTFLLRHYSFRYLLNLYHLLERNLLVVLVRCKYVIDLEEALYLVKNKYVYVNGVNITLPFFSTKLGDIVEIMDWQLKYFLKHYFPFFMQVSKYKEFYIDYVKPLVDFYFMTSNLRRKFIRKYLTLKMKKRYNRSKYYLMQLLQPKQNLKVFSKKTKAIPFKIHKSMLICQRENKRRRFSGKQFYMLSQKNRTKMFYNLRLRVEKYQAKTLIWYKYKSFILLLKRKRKMRVKYYNKYIRSPIFGINPFLNFNIRFSKNEIKKRSLIIFLFQYSKPLFRFYPRKPAFHKNKHNLKKKQMRNVNSGTIQSKQFRSNVKSPQRNDNFRLSSLKQLKKKTK